MNADLIDNSLHSLPAAPNFMLIYLLNSYLRMRTYYSHSSDTIIARLRQIYDTE